MVVLCLLSVYLKGCINICSVTSTNYCNNKMFDIRAGGPFHRYFFVVKKGSRRPFHIRVYGYRHEKRFDSLDGCNG